MIMSCQMQNLKTKKFNRFYGGKGRTVAIIWFDDVIQFHNLLFGSMQI